MAEGYSPEEEAFIGRLKAAIDRAGRVSAVSERSGVPEKTIYNWLGGTNASKALAFARIAAAAGASVRSLLGMPELTEQAADLPKLADYLFVPILDVQAGAGSAVDNGDPEILGELPFPRALLQKMGVKPEHVKGLRSNGISMEPTIGDGSVVLVNSAATHIVDGRVYALRTLYGLRLKRLQRQMDGSVLLVSDNREMFPPERVDASEAEAMQVIGRAFWTERFL